MSIDQDTLERLLEAARSAAVRAYAPYSKFAVGAALLLDNGAIVSGCNVENASFPVTLCAERVAGSAAVAAGYRRWQAIVIVSPTGVSPCGMCRQFLAEFAPELDVFYGTLGSDTSKLHATNLQQLLPAQMTLDH